VHLGIEQNSAQICEVYLDAKLENRILQVQEPASAPQKSLSADSRESDYCTCRRSYGYEERRARDELQQILEMYVVAEMRPWIKTFLTIFSDRSIVSRAGTTSRYVKRTPYVGKLVNKYIYEQLRPVFSKDLRREPT